MSIKVENPAKNEVTVFSANELHVGVLYKAFDGDYETVYTITNQGHIVWFESRPNGLGSFLAEQSCRKFVLAPSGTKVTLE